MSTLDFVYNMELSFSQTIFAHHYTLRCLPRTMVSQRLLQLNVELDPEGTVSKGTDAFGNSYLYGSRRVPHSFFRVHVSGRIETVSAAEPVPESHRLAPFRAATPLTSCGAVLRQWAAALPADCGGAVERAEARMQQVAAGICYLPGSTDTATTAEQAAAAGCGVCQDEAHILLALLRADGYACRYVCGMMVGEGASHAWVEVATEKGWIGFDPTNRCRADGNYIVLAVGRDAADCPINRGIYAGTATHTSQILVRVDPANERGTTLDPYCDQRQTSC